MKQESKKLDIFEMIKEAVQSHGFDLDDQEIETYQEYANRLLQESEVS